MKYWIYILVSFVLFYVPLGAGAGAGAGAGDQITLTISIDTSKSTEGKIYRFEVVNKSKSTINLRPVGYDNNALVLRKIDGKEDPIVVMRLSQHGNAAEDVVVQSGESFVTHMNLIAFFGLHPDAKEDGYYDLIWVMRTKDSSENRIASNSIRVFCSAATD